jgi:hypothetical protein
MRQRAIFGAIVALLAIAGCSRDKTVTCTPDARYSTARSAAPVQIPDDLSPPNESDALRLPPDGAVATTAAPVEYLDAPPSFFGDSQPFRRGSNSEGREPAPAEQAPAASDAPAAGGDRVIDN